MAAVKGKGKGANDPARQPLPQPVPVPVEPEPSRETVVLHFKASITRSPRGGYSAQSDEFPGVVASGETEEQAQQALQSAILKSLSASSAVALEPVYEEPLGFIPYAMLSHGNHLVAATNLDIVLLSETGNRDSWTRIPVTQQPSEYFQVFEGGEPDGFIEPGEYLTQLYSMAAWEGPEGSTGLYAGTNMKGMVYMTENLTEWRPAFNTGEDRVHSLASFGGFLFAGTSPKGRIYRWDGAQSERVHQSRELGITAMTVYRDAIYAGTYPEGLILRSEDGEAWEIVLRTGQRFINQLFPGKDSLYAACSHPAGGAIYRTGDGVIWEKCFHSEKDVNVFSLANFGGRLYAGTGDSGRLYSSRDGGTHWELTAVSPEAALRILAVHKGRLVIGCEQRGVIYRTALTEAPLPKISDVTVTSLASAVAVVEWATDAPCDAILQYGVGQTRDQTVTNPTLSRRHKFKLDGLKAGTRYTFLIRSRNDNGGQAVYLGEEGFVTQVLPPPVLTFSSHPEEDKWYSSRSVKISWTPIHGASRYLVRFAQGRVTQLSADDLQVKEAQHTQLVPSDGAWSFAVAAVDEAGNVGDLASRTVRIDSTALVPVVSCLTHPDSAKWYSLPVAEMDAEGTDENSGVEGFLYAIGRTGETWEHLAFQRAPAPRWKLPRLPDGTWDVFVRLRDNAGNESPPVVVRICIDTAAPEVVLEPLPRLMRAGEVEIRWRARDDRSGVARVMVQQKFEGTEWTTLYEGTGDFVRVRGEDGWRVWFRVVAEDGAGMRASAESHESVSFDGSPPPPVTSLESKSLPGGDIMLKWAPVEDPVSGTSRYHIYRSAEEGSIGIKTGSVQASVQEFTEDGTGLAHGGRYFFRILAEDGMGNVQADGFVREGVCDKEASAAVLRSSTHDPEKWTDQTDAIVEWDVPEDHTGVSEYLWRLDRNPSSSLTRGVDTGVHEPVLKLSRLMDGLWYVHVAVVDGAGNVSPACHYPLRIITKVLASRLASLPSVWNKHGVLLSWDSDEGVVAVDLGMREGGSRDWTVVATKVEGGTREVLVPREGLFEFSVRPMDDYGRWGVWGEGQVVLIDTVPPLEIPEVRAASRPDGAIHIEWDASWDELSGLAAYRIYRSRNRVETGELIGEVLATADCVLEDGCEGAEEGTKFHYRVFPLDSAGNIMEQSPVAEAICDRSIAPPNLVSRSHPDSTRAYASRKLEVAWDAVDANTGVAGIVVELSSSPAVIPNHQTLPVRTDHALTFELPEDGRWYLHARSVDGAGNASEPVHLPVLVDTHCDVPRVSLAQDPFMEWQSSGKISVVLKAPDDISGVTGFWHILDQKKETIPEPKTSVRYTGDLLKIMPSEEGLWYLHVACEDAAGNISEPVHLAMRLTTGLPMPRIISCTHAEGLWSHDRELAMEWEQVEGDRISYLYWIDATRMETPPASAVRVSEPKCRLNVEEGDWFLHLCSTDDLARRSAVIAYQVRVDATAPELSLFCSSHPRGEWSAKRRISYAVTAEDAHSAVAHIELALVQTGMEPDVWELALGTEGEREVPGEGLWTLWARAFDQAGNVSTAVSWDIAVDLVAPPPSINSLTHPEGEWSPLLRAELLLQPGEDLSGVARYSVAVVRLGEEVPMRPPLDALIFKEESAGAVFTEDGRWTIVAWSEDLAGNVSLPARYPVAIDREASVPTGFSIEPTGEGGWIRSNEVKVTWRPGEEVSGEPGGYFWTLGPDPDAVPDEDSSFTPIPELEFGDIEDGIWFLHVRAFDQAGNLSETVRIKLAVDAAPPVLSLHSPEAESGEWIRQRHVTVETRADDPVSGVHGCFFTLHRLGGDVPSIIQGSWREEPSWQVDIPYDGEWIVTVAAMDGAGNLSLPSSVSVRVDSEAAPPEHLVSISHPDQALWYSTRDVVMEWKEPKEASGVACYRWKVVSDPSGLGELKDWPKVTDTSLKTVISGDGHWLVAVCTEDLSGNLSDVAICDVRVDSIAPVPTLNSPSHPRQDIWYAEGAVDVAYEAEDLASGIKDIYLCYSSDVGPSGVYEVVMGGRTSLNLAPGVWRIRAVSEDGAGNRSAPAEMVVMIDPAVRPPLVACESHPDSAKWYSNSAMRFSVVSATREEGRKFWWVLDTEPETQPKKPFAKEMEAGRLDVSASGSGEWYLHVVTAARDGSLASEAFHLRVCIDMLAPPAPVMRSSTHPLAPRRSKVRDIVISWDEPQDLSGIVGYDYTLYRSGVMGMRKEKSGSTTDKTMKFEKLQPGLWDLSVAARDGAGHAGPPGKYPVFIADLQDLCVSVKSESWRVSQVGMEVELRDGERVIKKTKTDGNGEAWFKDLQYGAYTVIVGMEKMNNPLVFDHVKLEEGEAHVLFEVSLAGAAWTICRNSLRFWIQSSWVDGGRVEILDRKEAKVVAHRFVELAKAETWLECAIPAGMLEGFFQLMGGPLNKLQWPPIRFVRLP